jgi:multimeric flavodoxin WrbA
MLETVLDVSKQAGFETELFQAGGRAVRGCLACGSCGKNKGQCVTDDWVNEVYQKMKAADAIILGSPTYFSDLTPELKAIIDRCGCVSRRDGNAFSRKVGAAVSAVRRAGGIHTLDSIQHFFLINDMIVPGSSYWNLSLSRDLQDYEKDTEGQATMERLGENIVWLLGKISK